MSSFEDERGRIQIPDTVAEFLGCRPNKFDLGFEVLCAVDRCNDEATVDFFSNKRWQEEPDQRQMKHRERMVTVRREYDGALRGLGLGLTILEPIETAPRAIKLCVVVEDKSLFSDILRSLSKPDLYRNDCSVEFIADYAVSALGQLRDWFDRDLYLDTKCDFVLATIAMLSDLHEACERLEIEVDDDGALGRAAHAARYGYLRELLTLEELGIFRAEDDTLYAAHLDTVRDLSDKEGFLEFDMQPWRDSAEACAVLATRGDLADQHKEYDARLRHALKHFRENLKRHRSSSVRDRVSEILNEIEERMSGESPASGSET